MRRDDPANWMWADAIRALSRAERLHRHMFRPHRAVGSPPAWEPPIDVLETGDQVLILAALPGVDLDAVETVIEDGVLVISGERRLPVELDTAVIHRMELPQGRFERHVALPPGRYDSVQRTAVAGCVLVSLHKAR